MEKLYYKYLYFGYYVQIGITNYVLARCFLPLFITYFNISFDFYRDIKNY